MIYDNDDYYKKILPAIYVGSFVGMTAFKLHDDGIVAFTFMGIFSGFFLQAFNGTFLVGGKYGFSAFLAVIFYHYSKRLLFKIMGKKYIRTLHLHMLS